MGESSFWYRPTRVVPDQRPLNGRRRRRRHCVIVALIVILSVQADLDASDEANDCSSHFQSAATDASFIDSINCWVIALLSTSFCLFDMSYSTCRRKGHLQ